MKFILYLIFFFPYLSFSTPELEFRWSGISGVYISDGEQSIYFDPVFNRPSLWNILFKTDFRLDNDLVKNSLKTMKIDKIDAIFISHSHADHVIDTPEVSRLTGAKVYGSVTTKYLSLSSGVNAESISVFREGEIFEIGKFKIKILSAKHSKILGLFHFQDGEITSTVKTPISLGKYKMGGSFSFLVTYKDFNFLVNQSVQLTKRSLDEVKRYKLPLVFQGIAIRDPEYIDKNLLSIIKPKVFIPLHHDNFFYPIPKNKKVKPLWFIDLEGFQSYAENRPYIFYGPTYFEKIDVDSLLKGLSGVR